MHQRGNPVIDVTHATFGEPPAFSRNSPRLRGARGKGMKYEGQVHELLQSKYADMYLPSPWIYFYDNARTLRYCQPDGLIFNFIRGRITIVEAKLRHTPQAYHQLFSLYRPLLRHMFPEHLWTIRCIEICKWYDMATVIPGPHQLRRDIEDADCDSMGVYIYAGK